MKTSSFLLAAASLASTISAKEDSDYVTTYPSYTTDFTIVNNQTHTPGHILINSPAPWDVVGGDALQIQLDITAGGNLPLPPYKEDAKDMIHSISIFLTSVITGLNLTISNPSLSGGYLNAKPIAYRQSYVGHYNDTLTLWQQPTSPTKDVRFRWPQCFVASSGFGQSTGKPSIEMQGQSYRGGLPVGAYNISLHQLYRAEGEEKFSVFNLPIIVGSDIGRNENEWAQRFTCFSLKSGTQDDDNWGEGEDWYWDSTAYPWAEGKGSTSVASRDVEEFVDWPMEESEEETLARVERDLAQRRWGNAGGPGRDVEGEGKTVTTVAGNGKASATGEVEASTSLAAGPRQTAALWLGGVVAGLAVAL